MQEPRDVDQLSGAATSLPLAGLNVIDFGVGMAAALVAKFLAEAGAVVHRFEPPAGDPFNDIYPAYRLWRSVLKSNQPHSAAREREMLASADICIIGGEDFPGMEPKRDIGHVTSANPRLIVLDIVPMLAGSREEPLHGADILVQARSGLVFEAYPDRPALLAFAPAAFGAALHGLTGIGAALVQRERDGSGQIIQAGLFEGAMAWPVGFVGQAENETPQFEFRAPKGARPLIFRTRDDLFIHVVLGSIGSKFNLYQTLGIQDASILPGDAGMPNPDDGPDRYFGDADLLAPYFAERDADELIAALKRSGVVCEKVRSPGDCWDDPQVRQNDVLFATSGGTEAVGQPVSWRFVQGGSAQRLPVADAPLAGIRIIDFGAFVAGPMVSVSLGDLGADVVKVEPPGGDLLRGLYKFFAGANRGKRCIAIEMKSEEGRSLAHSLVRDADIICSNFRGGVAERLGIDARSIHASQPDKIVVLNPGYGIAGPQVNDPAFDPCMQATCGHEVRAGGLGNPPVFNPMMMIDLCGGQLGAIGTLMALYRRLRDGSGATVTVPLLNAGMFLMSDIMRTADGGVLGPQHLLSDQTGYHPAEKLYQAQDGWIAVAARGEAAARAFGQACGVTSISRKSRHEWDEADMKALARAIGQLTVDAALELLRAAGVPAERCCETGARDYLCDDFNVAAGRVYEANRRVIGKTRGLGVLFAMSRARLMPSGELGGKGEDSRAIMAEAGLSLDQIQDLISRCIVVEN